MELMATPDELLHAEVYMKYERLESATLGGLLVGLADIAEAVRMGYARSLKVPAILLPALTIDEVTTGNSVKIRLGESARFAAENNASDDLVITIPRSLALPGLVGLAILTATTMIYRCDNERLTNIMLKRQLILKKAETAEVTLPKRPRAMKQAVLRAVGVLERVQADSDILHVSLDGLTLLDRTETQNSKTE